MQKFLRYLIGKPVAVLLAALLVVCLGISCACLSGETEQNSPYTLRITVQKESEINDAFCERGEAALAGLKDCRLAYCSLNGYTAVFTAVFDGGEESDCLTAALNKFSALGLTQNAVVSAQSADREFMQIALTSTDGESRAIDAQDFINDLSRVSGVYYTSANQGYYNGKEAALISVYAQRGVSYEKLSTKIKSKAAGFAADDGLSYSVVYDYSELLSGSRNKSALFLFLGALLCLAALFLLLKTLPSFASAAVAAITSAAGGLLLCPLVGFTPLSCAGILTGTIAACLIAGFSVSGAQKLSDRENPYRAAVSGAYRAVKPSLIVAAAAFCALIPLVFIGNGAAAFALPALLTVLSALPASLIAAPCLFCLASGGEKYRLEGEPQKKEAESVKAGESVKNVTAQPLTAADEARERVSAEYNGNRTIDDYVIPSLSDISKLSRKAKRAVRRRRMTADKPSQQLKKGFSYILSGALKKRGAVIAVCLIAAAALIALGFVSGAQLAPSSLSPVLDVEIVPVSKVVSEKETEQYALNAAQLLKSDLDGSQSVSLAFNRNKDGITTAKISVRLKNAANPEKAARFARLLLYGGAVWNTFIEARDGNRYTFGLDGGVSVYVYSSNASDSAAIYQRLSEEMNKVKGFKGLKVDTEFSGARAEGKYISKISAVFDGADFNSAVSSLNAKTAAVLSEFEGSFYRTGGTQRQMTAALGQILIALLISLALLYMLSATLTGSLLKPLAAMISLPLTLGGGLAALAICALPLSASALLGLFAACSVTFACACGVIFRTDYAVKEGVQPSSAAIKGAAAHLKYAVYCILFALCALLPLCFISCQAAGLGAAALGGIALGCAALMFVVPAAYLLVKRATVNTTADDAEIYDLSANDIEIELGGQYFKTESQGNYAQRGVPVQSALSHQERGNIGESFDDGNSSPLASEFSSRSDGGENLSQAKRIDEESGGEKGGQTAANPPAANPPAVPSSLPPPPDKILL